MKTRVQTSVFVSLVAICCILQDCKSKKVEDNYYGADLAASWNQKILEVAVAEDGLLTLKGVRTTAMMHIAMHDALNAIKPKYSHYAHSDNASAANPIASAAQAAYEVAINQYPDKSDTFEKELNKWLSTVGDKAGKKAGTALGKASASAILKARSEDRWNGEAEYKWHPMSPGVYAEFNEHSGTPEGFVFGAGWARAEPFMLPDPGYFRAPPPPEISSKAYVKAFNEVKEWGRHKSKSRTPDQTHSAMWWKDFVENSHNRLARELIIKEKLDLWKATRALALMNMSIYDAYVSVFNNKFFYNHWRPYTAIRWAANDGNPETEPEPEWNNLHKHTYPFPSYPSAHGSASGAAMTVLSNTLGAGDKYTFTMTTEVVDKAGPMAEKIEMDPSTRSFDSFSEACLEAAMSRLYLGIHFRYDSEEGNKLGNRIGDYASRNFLTQLN